MKYLITLVPLFMGCQLHDVVSPDATLAQLENARAFAGATLAFLPPGESGPSPTPPTPTPGETCQRCNGTGRIKPDGRIEIACPDCDGDGKTTSEVNQAWAETISTIAAPASKDHECYCGPNCRCVSECKCEWPGQCLGVPSPHAVVIPDPTITQRLVPKAPASIEWVTDLARAKKLCAATGKPALVHFYTDTCAPCAAMELSVFSDSGIAEYINQNFVACKVNAEWLGASRREQWSVSAVPAERVVRSDWSTYSRMESTSDPAAYLASLKQMVSWAQRPRTAAATTTSQSAARVYVQEVAQEPVYYLPTYHETYYQQPYYYQSAPMWFGGGGCANGQCF